MAAPSRRAVRSAHNRRVSPAPQNPIAALRCHMSSPGHAEFSELSRRSARTSYCGVSRREPSRRFVFDCRRNCDMCHERGKPRRLDRWANRVSSPIHDDLQRGATDATLAWTHSRARVKLCLSRGPARIQIAEPHVFAATHNRVRLSERSKLRTQCERCIHY